MYINIVSIFLTFEINSWSTSVWNLPEWGTQRLLSFPKPFLLTTLLGMWDLSSLTRDWTQAQQWDHWVPTTGQPGNSSETILFWWIHFIITIPGDGEWRFREQGRCYCPYLQRKRLSSKEVTCHLSGSQLVGNKGRIRTQVLGHQLRASLETFHSAVVCSYVAWWFFICRKHRWPRAPAVLSSLLL